MVFTDKINIVMHHSSQGMYKKNILSKSLNMEVFRSSIGVLLIFFLLVVGSRVVGYFEQAAEGNIDPGIILSVITLRFPDFITLLIPLSFFLGLLITIGRLNSEGEIHGYFSAGLSKFNLIKFLLPQAFIYFFITLVLSLYIAPYTKNLSKDLLVIDSFEEQIDAIQSDEIVSLDDGGFLYVQTADEGLIKGVKLFQVDEDNSFIVISDELLTTEKDKTIELNLKNGSFYGGLFSESSKIISKGISAGNANNTYRGLVNIHSKASNSRNFTQCDSLLIGNKCGAHTVPYIESSNSDSMIEHEATTSKINEDQLFYCMQRGLNSEDAVGLIVNGFCKEVLQQLPMEFAVEAQKLVGISLEGSVG